MTWSGDGRRIIAAVWPNPGELNRFDTWTLDPDGSNRVKLPIADTEQVWDWSPDGQWLLTRSARRGPNDVVPRFFLERPAYLFHPDGSGELLLVPGNYDSPEVMPRARSWWYRFSPDSRRISYVAQSANLGQRPPMTAGELWVVSVDGNGRRRILQGNFARSPTSAVWSPDGSSFAVVMSAPQLRGDRWVHRNEVVIVAADGSNPRLLLAPDVPSLYVLDWR